MKTELKNKQNLTAVLIKFSKIYFAAAALAVILTIPTKGIWLLITTLWNMF